MVAIWRNKFGLKLSQAAFLRGGSSVSAQKAGVGHWNFPDFGSKPFQKRNPQKLLNRPGFRGGHLV
ncbi:hypothetical protein AFE_1609 [Acidithiobacillus ferrooxidans ATCC 23270]|uniref:Uncharacterized protein n=1 Tax=Acidithiobacillus ferrooxidans (strain ATCC 23270 / DSM 14882 / CIP 104768 / NCIMB 8455) TaxID=243159 RepID=B7JAU9_ACIF2|nr:hypothetical protein AFE_1609 [Acidithiobacillus ferrooxidans ATCC 23270]